MEDQDARVPALEPFRVEQVVRIGGEGVRVEENWKKVVKGHKLPNVR